MKIVEIKEGYLKFDNGTTIEDYHCQECCESVYADFNYLKEMNVIPSTGENIKITDIDFDEDIQNHIEYEKEMGFKLISKDGSKWFVPCYDQQNGCYSSDLELIITKKDIKITIDISDYVKEEHC